MMCQSCLWCAVKSPYLVLPLFLILIYIPPLSIITVRHFVWADKLDMAKVFSALGDDTCDLGRNKQVHLKEGRSREKGRWRWLTSFFKTLKLVKKCQRCNILFNLVSILLFIFYWCHQRIYSKKTLGAKSQFQLFTEYWTTRLSPQPRLSKKKKKIAQRSSFWDPDCSIWVNF